MGDAGWLRPGAVGLAALGVCAGCLSPPPRAVPVPDLAPIAHARIAEPPPAPAVPPPAEPDTFTPALAVEYALTHNPWLQSMQADVARAAADIEIVGSTLRPHVDLLQRAVITAPTQGAGAPGLTGIVLGSGQNEAAQFLQSELQIQWTLADFGRTSGRVGQAAARERIAGARLARASQTVALNVASAYLQVLLAEAAERTRREALRSAELFRDDARTRRAAGDADRDDVLRADALVAAEADRLVEARRQVSAAGVALNNALGRNPGLPIRVASLDDLPPLTRTVAECLELSIARRPEVGIARDAVAAAIEGRNSRAAEYRPKVYVLTSGGAVTGGNVQSGLQGGAGLHLDVPISDGGLRRGELRAAEAGIASAAADARKIFDDVGLQVHLAHLDATAAAERVRLARPAVDESREYLRVVRLKYRNGTSTPADVADAEATATRAEDRYHAAAFDYLVALARLGYATGEGAETMLPSARLPESAPPPRPVPEVGPVLPRWMRR